MILTSNIIRNRQPTVSSLQLGKFFLEYYTTSHLTNRNSTFPHFFYKSKFKIFRPPELNISSFSFSQTEIRQKFSPFLQVVPIRNFTVFFWLIEISVCRKSVFSHIVIQNFSAIGKIEHCFPFFSFFLPFANRQNFSFLFQIVIRNSSVLFSQIKISIFQKSKRNLFFANLK